jgi:hypothetical protein
VSRPYNLGMLGRALLLRTMRKLAITIALLVLAPCAFAEICKYIDSDGQIHYSNVPPEQGWKTLSCGVDQAPPEKPICYVEPASRKTSCFDATHVLVQGDVRRSELLLGGPDAVHGTDSWLEVDCKRKTLAIQNTDGVNLEVGSSDRSEMSRMLSRELCKLTPDR